MIVNKFFRLHAPETDAGGGGGAEDRGDLLVVPEVIPPAVEDIKADPVVKELEAEIEADDEKHAAKDTRIPLARHKEILEKERVKTAAVQAENTQLKQRSQTAATTTDATAEFAAIDAQIEALETEYATSLTDGNLKQAAETMKKIRAAERYMSESKADLKIQAAAVESQESARYQTALSRIETAYPVLNPDTADFDEITEARVARMNHANRLAGMSAVAAIQDAVETILGTATAQQERATSVTPRAAKDVAAERTKEAIEKAAKAVAKTPPNLSHVGVDSDKLGGGKLSVEQAIKLDQRGFAALSDADLSLMRGDTV